MKQLVPIKVRIGLRADGTHDYPNFNVLPSVKAAHKDWAHYVDNDGLGWQYDKCCGHRVEKPRSPLGIQFGVLIVPEVFANEALATFPSQVVRLNEAELEAFYNEHAHGEDPDEEFDLKTLEGIKFKKDLGLPLTLHQLKAIDSDDPTPGIKKNKKKYWADFKKEVDVQII